MFGAAWAIALTAATAAQVIEKPAPAGADDASAAAIARGVAYLVKEAPQWKAQPPCAACRYNGDATRALLAAAARGYDIGSTLDQTLQFLKQPRTWDQGTAAEGFDDKMLARLQFASALAVAERHGRAASTDLEEAAKLVVADQKGDGSWTVDPAHALGSPLTYGTILATWSARATLLASGKQPDDFSIVQADRWTRGLTVENALDASGVILALDLSSDVMAETLRRASLGIVRTAQAPGGGWGPEAGAPPQVFDTAVAILALSLLDTEPRLARSTYRPEELKDAIAKGKAYLIAQQRPDGSWPETTRPAGQESYAQRISTTGWALLALLK